jgi:fatty-acyl-CoA synthase
MVLVDDTGDLVAHDGKKSGRLLVRGPWVVERYYREGEGNVLNQGGWFDTGDIATIDEFGYMKITDRAKDVVKSGGEWISSIEIENLALSHPAVANAAAVGVPHPKWGERPVLVVEPRPGMTVTPEDLRAHLDAIPLGATGKINKLALRDLLRARRGATEKP